MEPNPDPDTLYRSKVRATMPKRSEQLDAALSGQLARAEKQALDVMAAWPFRTTEQLGSVYSISS